MLSSVRKGFRLAAVTGLGFALAVPQAASAQLFLRQPDFKGAPIEGSDPLVGTPIPGATAAEYRAHLIWNMRSGLNVAALQCQFSPYLRAVPNYNAFLAHHGDELASAYTVLTNYFKRVKGPVAGMKQFDDYSTTTYNNFSTYQAQLGFCQTAAAIARGALLTPKGELYAFAAKRMRELRNSLVPAYEKALAYNPWLVRLPPLPPLSAECYDKKNRLKERCLAG